MFSLYNKCAIIGCKRFQVKSQIATFHNYTLYLGYHAMTHFLTIIQYHKKYYLIYQMVLIVTDCHFQNIL